MKTFYTFKEDLKKSLSPLKDFGKSFAGQAEKFGRKFAKEGEKFVKSPEANQLKTDVFNFFLDKAQGANNNLGDTIKNIRSKVNK